MSEEAKRMVNINRDVGEYTEELEEAYANHHDGYGTGKPLPEEIFERFCGELSNGTRDSIGGDGYPSDVISRLAEGSDFGPIENYSPLWYLNFMLRAGRKLYFKEYGVKRPCKRKLRDFIRANRERVMKESRIFRGGVNFWYRDDDAEYGISICLGFGA